MTVTVVTKAGIADVSADANALAGNAAGANYFYMPNDGRTLLIVAGGASAKQITFTAVADKYGRTETLAPSPTVSKVGVYGPFPPDLWNQSNGCVKFQPATSGDANDKYLAVRF